MQDWLRATDEFRRQLWKEKLEAELSAIDGKPTRQQIKTAENLAKAHVVRTLFDTEEYNGVRNPTWDDPVWREKTRPKKKEVRDAPESTETTDLQRVREALRRRA